jgi:hypothetical protein
MSIVVMFRPDFRSDDARSLLDILKNLPGVLSVNPVVCSGGDYMDQSAMGVESDTRLIRAFGEMMDQIVKIDPEGKIVIPS